VTTLAPEWKKFVGKYSKGHIEMKVGYQQRFMKSTMTVEAHPSSERSLYEKESVALV